MDAPQASSADAPSIVLFVIDTLRADHLGSYGAKGASTPALDALARESVLFENAHSAAPWTLPSVVSLLTSTFACEHLVVVDGDRLPDAIVPLASRLRAAGYTTASFYANPYAGAMTGLDRGFDQSHPIWSANGAVVRHWLEADPGRPFFLYLHNIEPHGPYGEDAPALGGRPRDGEGTELNRTLARYSHQTRVDFEAQRPIGTTDNTKLQQRTMKTLEANREKILELYEKDVALADATLGGVVAELRRAGLWNEILFILVSDHGEEFGEHGGWHHDQSVYEELLRVPLLIRLPGARSGGTRVSEPVSLVDLLPTLAELLELSDLADGARGRSLLPWMGGSESKKSPRRRALPRVTSMRINRKKFYRPFKEKRGDVNVVVRDGRWKAIWNVEANAIELYDLKADAGEKFDWAAREPKRARKLRRVAKQWQARCGAAGARAAASAPAPERPIDPDSRERLRALGYLDAED